MANVTMPRTAAVSIRLSGVLNRAPALAPNNVNVTRAPSEAATIRGTKACQARITATMIAVTTMTKLATNITDA